MNASKSLTNERSLHLGPQRLFEQRFTVLGLVLSRAGCAAYAEPKPGAHRAPGDARAENTSAIEAPMATRFVGMRCIRTADLDPQARAARETLESLPAPLPPIR